jgi:hypothetical protein
LSHVANSEVLVFGYDAPATSNRKSPNLTIVGIPQPNVTARYRFFSDRRQEPCQRWRQLGIDEEPHAVRLSDKDGMVEILGGVLKAGADVLPLQVRVVGKNLILRRSGSEHLKNVLDPYAHVTNARPPPALSGLDGDSRLRGCCCHMTIIRPASMIGKSGVIQ